MLINLVIFKQISLNLEANYFPLCFMLGNTLHKKISPIYLFLVVLIGNFIIVNNKIDRKTYVYGDEFWKFYNSRTKLVQDKIDWVIGLVRTLKVIPEKFFKHLKGTDGLFEMRIKLGSNIIVFFVFLTRGIW